MIVRGMDWNYTEGRLDVCLRQVTPRPKRFNVRDGLLDCSIMYRRTFLRDPVINRSPLRIGQMMNKTEFPWCLLRLKAQRRKGHVLKRWRRIRACHPGQLKFFKNLSIHYVRKVIGRLEVTRNLGRKRLKIGQLEARSETINQIGRFTKIIAKEIHGKLTWVDGCWQACPAYLL